MPVIKLKDYDNCERLGHDFSGMPSIKDTIDVIDSKTGGKTGESYTSYCVRCNLDRVGWKMPKSYWKRPKPEYKTTIFGNTKRIK